MVEGFELRITVYYNVTSDGLNSVKLPMLTPGAYLGPNYTKNNSVTWYFE